MVWHGVSKAHFLICLCFMRSGHIILKLCFDYWNRYALLCSVKVMVYCNLFSVTIAALKSYHGFSTQCRAIKGKGKLHASIRFVRCKGYFLRYLFSVNEQRFSGCLIHKASLHGVLFARNQTMIFHGISKAHFLICLCFVLLCHIIQKIGINLREINGLLLVLDVLMGSNVSCPVIYLFKHNHGFSLKVGCIQGVSHFYGFFVLCCSKDMFCCYLLSIHQQRCICISVHQNTLDTVFTLRNNTVQRYLVCDGNFFLRCSMLLIRAGDSCLCSYRNRRFFALIFNVI